MKIYTTLRSKYLAEYFGDAYKAEINTLMFGRKTWTLEMYYSQEIEDGDLFLMIPHFSQISLVTLLDKDGFTPIYLTAYKADEKPDDFFEDIGALCPVADVPDLLPVLEKFSQTLEKHSHLPSLLSHFPLLENVSLDDEQKKTLDKTPSALSADYSPVNNVYFEILNYGTRTAGRGTDTYIRKFHTIFFKLGDIKYYCSFTTKKAYFFIDRSDFEEYNDRLVKLIEDLVEQSVLLVSKESEYNASKSKTSSSENDENKLAELKKRCTDASLEILKKPQGESFFLQVAIPSSSDKDLLLPIPLSNEKVYSELYFFIQLALNKKKIHSGDYDEDETEISVYLDKDDSFDKDDFYTRYTLFFLSQYMKDVKNIVPEAKTTLYSIIQNLAYRSHPSMSATMMLNYHTKLEKWIKEDPDEKIYDLFEYIKAHNKVSDYFVENDDSKERMSEFRDTINKNLTTIVKDDDSEADKITKAKINIQKYICRKENKCLSEEARDLICGKHNTGKRFQSFKHYFDTYQDENYYDKLKGTCKKKIDEYFKLSVKHIEDDNEYSNEKVWHPWRQEKLDANLDDPIVVLKDSIDKLCRLSPKNFLDYPLDIIEKHTGFPLETLIVRFLKSYNMFAKYPAMRTSLKISPYNRVLFVYMEKGLEAIRSNSPERLKEAKNKIRNILFLLSNENINQNHPRVILGDVAYYDWAERFYLLVSAHDIVDWIYEEGEHTGDSWVEISRRLLDPTMRGYYDACKSALPEDVRLEQSRALFIIEIYARSIVDVYGLLKDGFKNDDPTLLAQKLNALELNRQNKALKKNEKKKKTAEYILFKAFLTTDTPEIALGLYTQIVVIETNKEDYFPE